MSAGRVSVAQAGAVVACSWLLALVAIRATQLVHQGLHEHNELPPVLHWLRDAAVAVPLAALAIGLAAVVVQWAIRTVDPRRAGSLVPWLAWAFLAALLFAVLSIPGNQLHGLLFGAEEEAGVGWLEDALLDGGIVFGASLLVLVPVALLGRPIWRAFGVPQERDQATGPAAMAAGLSASLATAGSTHVGGDR